MPTPLLRQVKASAGSGKTYDLTRRFMELLSRARQQPHAPTCAWRENPPSADLGSWGDLLAVTFTNSAAAEMKERVVRRLKETALELADASPINAVQAAQWVDIILRQYGALNIRTIDSLLHMVVRTAALDLGLPPDFEPAFATDETLTPILDACMERAWQGDARMRGLLRAACRSLIYHGNATGFVAGERILDRLRPLLDAALTRHWPPLTPPERLEARYGQWRQECQSLARALICLLEAENLPTRKGGLRDVAQRCAEGDDKALASAYLAKDCLDECLLKAGKGTASAEALLTYSRLTQAVARLRGPGSILQRGMQYYPFAVLAQEVAAGLEAFQQAEGKIPGALMAPLAREVLELQHGVSTALCRLGSSLNHILIDEFQDTSREQWDALRPLIEESLARGGSFTWVGDVKQAIYGWRGGDAALFDGVLEDAGLRAIATLSEQAPLRTNWRSRETVVSCNNTLFSLLQDADTARTVLSALVATDCPQEILHDAADTLSGSFAGADQDIRPDGAPGGYVTMTSVSAPNVEELNDAVREALHSRLVEDIAARRPWSDVTILVRSNKNAALAASWLMSWQVPVITENSLLLAEHPLIAETLAWLQWLDCPQDDVAFWTVLTGTLLAPCLRRPDAPDCESLYRWAATRRQGYASMAFKESFPHFWRQWFAPFHNRANLLTPYDTVQEWYRLLGVDARFPEARTFLRRLLEVVHTAAERGHATLGTFLEYWTRNGGDEKVPMPASTDAVRIMTIHKSKGLQFPVVIIPWMHFSVQKVDTPVPYAVEDMQVLAPLGKDMGELFYARQADAAREALNLWYVAWTRPEEELHIFHTSTPKLLHNLARALDVLLPKAGYTLPCELGTPAPAMNPARPASAPCLAAQEREADAQKDAPGAATAHTTHEEASTHDDHSTLAPCHAAEPDLSVQPRQCARDGSEEQERRDDALLPEHDDEWRPMQWLPRLKIYRNPLQEMAFTAKRRGILAHHCLENLTLSGDAEEDARRAVQLGLRTFPLSVPDPEAVTEDLARALAWYAALPDAARWMRQGLPEQSIMDAKGRLHRVDLLIPPASGQGWVAIDYKTGDEDDAHPAQIRRYLAQLDALPESEGLPPSHGILIYLDQQRCRTVTRRALSALSPVPLPPASLPAQNSPKGERP